MPNIPPYFEPGATMEELRATQAQEDEIWKACVRGTAEIALKDFEYHTHEAQVEALESLTAAIEEAINKWIELNCEF